jgi:hypothetical protein
VLGLRVFSWISSGEKSILWGIKCNKFLSFKLEGYTEEIVVVFLKITCLDEIGNSRRTIVLVDGALAEIRIRYLPHRIPSSQLELNG